MGTCGIKAVWTNDADNIAHFYILDTAWERGAPWPPVADVLEGAGGPAGSWRVREGRSCSQGGGQVGVGNVRAAARGTRCRGDWFILGLGGRPSSGRERSGARGLEV